MHLYMYVYIYAHFGVLTRGRLELPANGRSITTQRKLITYVDAGLYNYTGECTLMAFTGNVSTKVYPHADAKIGGWPVAQSTHLRKKMQWVNVANGGTAQTAQTTQTAQTGEYEKGEKLRK